MKLKVLVADKFPEKYIQQMKDIDLDVDYQPKLGEKDLPEAAKDVDILIVRSHQFKSEIELDYTCWLRSEQHRNSGCK
jgi:D-3-phosphoglycerate dehydrogenase